MAFVAGCGGSSSNQPKLVPVTGTVTLDGKPLSGVSVSLIPTGATRGTGASGYTNAAGRYEITASHGGRGSPVGEYRVVAAKLVMPDGSDFPINSNIVPIDSPAKQILPLCYSHPQHTVLKATVQDGPNTIDFPLSSKPQQ